MSLLTIDQEKCNKAGICAASSKALKVDKRLEPLKEEDREFAAAVREGRDPLVTGEHGVAAIEAARMVVDSITESLEHRP